MHELTNYLKFEQDYQSEKFVQETLDRASIGRTTITVSHRLSAIRKADRIVFIEGGIVVEDGAHDQLMAMKGRYYQIITAGNLAGNGDGLASSETTMINRPKTTQRRLSMDSFEDTKVNCIRKLSISDNKSMKTDDEPIQYGKTFVRILKLARPEWLIVLVASVAALLIGISIPMFSILFAELFGVGLPSNRLRSPFE